MDHDDLVMSGTLLFPPHGMVFTKLTKKKSWHQKYCMLFKASKQGIERLEIFDSKEDCASAACSRIITLENCIKITHSNPNAITIVTKTLTQQLSVLSESEALEWLTALQSVAFRDDSCRQMAIDEDNDLYCSSGEGVFSVKLYPSDASTKCGFEATRYILVLTTTAIELRDVNDNKLYATWPYRYIRRYGYRQGKFTFEAGRKCQTGEGTFHLEHSKQQEIFRCLSLKMKSMKKMMNGEPHLSPDISEGRVKDVMRNEARSRSPLPTDLHCDQFDLSSVSLKTNSVASQSVDSTASLLGHASKPALKPKPVKPVRKHNNIFSIAKEKHESDFVSENINLGKYRKLDNYEPVELISNNSNEPSKPYDRVEVRSEAWKTLGLDHVHHKEFITSDVDSGRCLKLISRSQDNLDADMGEPSVIILQTPTADPEDAEYDRLQYFGSINKLNKSAEMATYKQVEPRPTLTLNPNLRKDIWNDYDDVENVMQSVRLADDSHLGYGMIRKANPPPADPSTFKKAETPPLLTQVDHNKCNGSDYALVSRPKRV